LQLAQALAKKDQLSRMVTAAKEKKTAAAVRQRAAKDAAK
jgi:hypothetical protein